MKFSMKKSLKLLKSVGFGIATFAVIQPAFSDWTVQGSQILDPKGVPFVYRGVNLGILPSDDSLPFVMRDIAATGANAVRIPVEPFSSKERIKKLISLCKQYNLQCVLVDVSTYGYGDNVGYYTYSDPWSSWNSLADVLNESQDYVVIDITSAPTGNIATSNYLGFTETGILIMRLGGIKNQLIVGGANWGQDWENVMRNNAEYLLSKDPLKNLVFSVHMFEAYNEPSVIRNYLKSYLDRQLPIIISEFGPVRRNRTNELISPYTNKDVDEDAIMAISQELGVGYMGWSWSGNTTNFADLNMVTDLNPSQLTPWGNKFINSENGVKATARLATHYASASSTSSSVSSSSSSVSSQANHQPYAVISARVIREGCGSIYAQLSGAESTDADGDALTYKWEIYDPSNYSYDYRYGKEINYYMSSPAIEYSFSLYIDDNRGGTSTATKQLSHSYTDDCMGSSSSSSTVYLSSSSSSSIVHLSSSSIVRSSSSSIRPSSSSVQSSVASSSRPSSLSSSSRSSSSLSATTAACTYVVSSQWNNGFTAAIRIKNTGTQVINGWDVNWQYSDGSKVTNLWNATLGGSNPYNAKNLNWNASIQPGQTVEFGFQGSKSAATASVPVVSGSICK